MELVSKKKLVLISGRANMTLAEEVARHLNVRLSDVHLATFANGEIYARFGESIRGSDVFIIQSHNRPINDHLMEQLIMIDAAKRASAKRITAVCPFYGYSRQDKKSEGREPITARLVADMITAAGADRVVSVDLHQQQIQGFFNMPVDHLTASPLLADYLREVLGADADPVIVSPDAGGVKRAQKFANYFSGQIAFIYKRRPTGTRNVAQALEVIGEIEGRTCVLLDDIIDTAGTIVGAAELLTARGAGEVYVAATHAILSDPAVDRLKNAPVREVIVTNTLPVEPEKQWDGLRVLSIAPIIADALDAVFEDTSVSEIFRGDNF